MDRSSEKGPPPFRSPAGLLGPPSSVPSPRPSPALADTAPRPGKPEAGVGGRWWAWCSIPAGRRCGKLLLEGGCSDGLLGLWIQGPVFPLPQQTEKGLQQLRSEQWSCWLRSSGGRPPPSERNDLERLLLGNWAVRPVTLMLRRAPPFSAEP